RAHTAEERAAADRNRFRLARHPHVTDVIVGGDALDQRSDPVVRQRGGKLDAAFGQLLVDSLGHIHRHQPSCSTDRLLQGAAAMTSTSTKNSGRENPETIISVEAGGGSAI